MGTSDDSSEIAVHVTVPASDFDGDGKTDIAVYRPGTGSWYVLLSSTNSATYVSYQWGVSTDIPVAGDYDGDGKTDIAIYRPATGSWYVLLSTTNFATFVSYQWGVGTDIPVPGDSTTIQSGPR
jgi:FG-GAP-like repeat